MTSIEKFLVETKKFNSKKWQPCSRDYLGESFRNLITNRGNRINPPEKNPQEKIPLNAVEREPVETRVLNPNASEASYKPKQRSCRKTKL